MIAKTDLSFLLVGMAECELHAHAKCLCFDHWQTLCMYVANVSLKMGFVKIIAHSLEAVQKINAACLR